MRTENIRVKFEIPFNLNKPDLNGIIYTKEAVENAYKDVKNIPIGIHDDSGRFIPLGVSQEVELIESNDGILIKGMGLIFHGGTNESVEITDGKVTKMHVDAIGIAKE